MEIAALGHADEDGGAFHLPAHGRRAVTVVATERDVQRRQPRDLRTLDDARPKAHRIALELRRAHDFEDASRVAVDPPAGVLPHLESGGHTEELPLPIELHEEAKALRAEQPEPAVLGGEEPVDADVALRDHGMEDARHPRGGSER